MFLKTLVRLNLVFILCLIGGNGVFAEPNELQRQRFLAIEKQLKRGGTVEMRDKIADLKGYPLHAYLWYEWLKLNLDLSADVAAFQQQYPNSRYAKPLRTRQMNYFAERDQWWSVTQNFREGDGITQQCQYYWALYKTGDQQQAMQGAASLWLNGRSLPKHCDPLLEKFVGSHHFTGDINWQRFHAALKNRKPGLAKYLIRFFNKKDTKIAEQWLAVHKNPGRVSGCHNWDYSMPQSAAIFRHGVQRQARRNLDQAIKAWDSRKHSFNFTQQQLQDLEQELAIRLVKNRNDQADSRFQTLNIDNDEINPWRVKAALLAQNWGHVVSAIEMLSPEQKGDEKWLYWRARAHFKQGEMQKGKQIYQQLAKQRSFYGYLAADYLGQAYQLVDNPVQADPLLTRELLNRPSFQAAKEFLHFGRDNLVRQQWWFAIRDLDTEQIKAAAKIAQQWGLPQLAIITIAKAKYWDDVTLRFPVTYQHQVEKHAIERGLEPAIVYGVIRRESAFNVNAQSPVGARGLMQIMPRTGRAIARDLKERWPSKSSLFDANTNIKYGTFYFKQLADRFDGNYALAAAGYNAGPHRVKKWRPNNKPMPADIWIELIPFNETRKYVSAVLTYALVYQAQLGGDSLKMTEFFKDIMPGEALVSQLDKSSSENSCS